MALLDRVKERCGSDLSDTELSSMIDAIVGELDARLGPVGPVTVELGDPADPHSRFHRTLRVLPPIDAEAELTIVDLDPGHHRAELGRASVRGMVVPYGI